MRKRENDVIVFHGVDMWILNRISKRIYKNGVQVARDTESFISGKLVYSSFEEWVKEMAMCFKKTSDRDVDDWFGAPEKDAWEQKIKMLKRLEDD